MNGFGCRVACRFWPLLQGWKMGGGLPGVCAAGADPAEERRGESLPILVGALPGFGDGVGAVAAGAAGLRLSVLLRAVRENLQAVRLNPGELRGMGTAGDFIPCGEMAETVRRSGKMLYSSADGSATFSAFVNLSILSTMAR